MPYPSREEIQDLCSSLGTADASPFFNRVAPDVVWDVMGTSQISGRYTSLDDWKKGAYNVAQGFVKEHLTLTVVNVVGGAQEWAVVELEADAVCKNGMKYPQRYAWVMRFNESGIIVQVRAYLDSLLLENAITSNAS
ncbi:hypothetical protein M409DRAFT_69615 [Zasmidium cellare ATCC 36951]|uniref:SnoaL-like domain-containing protein n=1 Tax=Zasmidium cellare ATCC 36951 TaxID=1080233 RepID=A0A6A6C473_ZASCE|nr:uncharacterized protein M409DRAFT_69615 [Zasmidium cellare ATCC 36951]KAF2161821.1 hypothetical protein M409DRAFT_69615 [Zasmidium cellare ATCC 36951]